MDGKFFVVLFCIKKTRAKTITSLVRVFDCLRGLAVKHSPLRMDGLRHLPALLQGRHLHVL